MALQQGGDANDGEWASVVVDKVPQSTATDNLLKVQQATCLGIEGSMRGTPTASMEVVLNRTPLDIYVKGDARIAAFRLRYMGSNVHTRINESYGWAFST